MPRALAWLARGAGEHDVVLRDVHSRVEALGAVDHPVLAVLRAPWSRATWRRCRGRARSGRTRTPISWRIRGSISCCCSAEPSAWSTRTIGKFPTQRGLGLEVRVEPERLVREVLADDRHLEVGPVGAAERRREREAVETGCVGACASSPTRSSSHSRAGMPPRSTSVRANSRRWSKNWGCCAFERAELPLDEGVDSFEQQVRVESLVHRHPTLSRSPSLPLYSPGDGLLANWPMPRILASRRIPPA